MRAAAFVLVALMAVAVFYFAACDERSSRISGEGSQSSSGHSPGSWIQEHADSADGSEAAAKSAVRPPREDVKTTGSGLKYKILKRGTGTVSPKDTDTVEVHYHGSLPDGTVFDSSEERGQPVSFPLTQVIKGWNEGVQLMKEGDRFRFEIPSDLAYGDRRVGDKIPPNSTLIFEVELLKVLTPGGAKQD